MGRKGKQRGRIGRIDRRSREFGTREIGEEEEASDVQMKRADES